MRPGTSLGARYAVAVAMFGGAALFRFTLHEWLGDRVPLLQFSLAVMLAAWFGGLGPGLLTTTLSTLTAMYFLMPPSGIGVSAAADQLSLAIFIVTGVVISWLSDQLHQAQREQRGTLAIAAARTAELEAVLDTTLDGIIVINAAGTIDAFNRGAQEMFGYPASEVVGRNVSILMPSPHHEDHDKYLEGYLTTGKAKVIGIGRQVMGRRRNGTTFPLHLAVGEMQINGERKFTGMLHDLTKRMDLTNQLHASEGRARTIIDTATDGIIVIDTHARIETFNPAAERLFGYTTAEVLGRNVDMLMPSPYHEEHDTYLSRYLATGRAKIIGSGREVLGLRKDGTTFPLHLSIAEIAVEGERKFTGILHDLSDRVRMEGRLREREALARLGEMAAVIAHEVKNPLAGIRGAVQVFGGRLIQDEACTPIITEIVARIDALDRMMEDMLLFARPPKPNRAPIDVVPLVRTTASLLNEDPSLKHVDIEVHGAAPLVSADPDMLKVVFQNLLINSAHAMQGRGTIRVSVGHNDASCEIAVVDGGPGIPAEVRPQIFTPFFTTKSRGSGLGLPTVKRFIEAHNGEVAIDCPPAGGTTVLIRLPIGGAADGQPARH